MFTVQVLSAIVTFIFLTLGEMGWREFALFCLLKIEGKKMLRAGIKTITEEIVNMQEELGAIRDMVVAREQERLMVISAVIR